MPKAISFDVYTGAHRLAADIALKYNSWQNHRQGWLELTQETRDYIFATDTRTTTAGNLGWKNSTHLPKLCQIRDNLHANYMAAVFPNDRAISWEADDMMSGMKKKRESVEAYMRNKMRQNDFRNQVSLCLLDFIDYGNCFAMTEFVSQEHEDPYTGETIQGYVGPRMKRISPLDIVFDPTAEVFEDAPKIVRTITTLAEIAKAIEQYPEKGYLREVFEQMQLIRAKFRSAPPGPRDVEKNAAYLADGFSSWQNYFDSDYVELLEFYGDVYDKDTGEFSSNQHIVVADRAFILKQGQHQSWLGKAPIFHAGWRQRHDNLYAMGPLDNLIGLQYRIDHLENAKADAMDLIVQPVFKIRGFVEDFEYGPNARIYVGDDGDVEFMSPDASALSANTEIAQIMQVMEEMAGAPRQAMGFRTPGEKTKFEVQILENGANRVFLNKTAHFETIFLEPILNSMLESARRNFTGIEQVPVEDMDYRFVDFLEVTKEDLTAKGTIRAIGARRFARKANLLQDLTTFSGTGFAQDPSVMVHFSGLRLARVLEELLDLSEYKIVEENVRVAEQAKTAQLSQASQQMVAEEQALSAGAPPNVNQNGMAQGG